jgi:type II secretory pathway pseudopilin PulG
MRLLPIDQAMKLLRRLRSEDGFGLVELVFAIVLLNVGILTIVAAFSSTSFVLGRAALLSAGTAVADKQLESYRARPNCAIYLTSSSLSTVDSRYTGDPAYSASEFTDSTTPQSPIPSTCTSGVPSTLTTASQTILGPDQRNYRVDTYITQIQPTNGGYTKQVVVVVRNPTTLLTYVREASTFDPSSG